MVKHFILQRFNTFGLMIYNEGWWFEHSVSKFQILLSEEGVKNVSSSWLSPLRGWSSLIMTFTGTFVYMALHFFFLRLNPFCVRIDNERWRFQHSVSQLQGFFSAQGCKKLSWPWLSPLRGSCSLTMIFTGNLVYIAHNFILLQLNSFGLTVDQEG